MSWIGRAIDRIRLPVGPLVGPLGKERSSVKPVKDPGYISFPAQVKSVNVFLAYGANGEGLPPTITQWKDTHDFHVVPLSLSLASVPPYEGVEWCHVALALEGRPEENLSNADKPTVEDMGPKTEWKDRAVRGSVEIGIDAAAATALISPVAKGLPVNAEAKLTYEWNPQIETVAAGGKGGQNPWWTFNAEPHKSLTGDIDLFLLIRRPRNVKNLKLRALALAEYDNPNSRFDDVFVEGPTDIAVDLHESLVEHPAADR